MVDVLGNLGRSLAQARPAFKILIRVAGVVVLAGPGCRPAGTAPPSTVVLVSVDTLRPDRLGAYGYAASSTPAIDSLAREGLAFERAWSVAPLTLPAHASMLTGLYPPRHGVRVNGVHRLSASVPLVTESFGRAGFRTAAFVGGYPLARRFGLARGFDVFDDTMPARPDGFHYPERLGREVVDAALRWLAPLPPAERVFLFVHLYDPHAEYRAPAPYGQRFEASPYDGEVAYADSAVAVLRDGLRSARRWDDAVVLFTSDHGEALGAHGEETHGLLLHDATLRVPFLLKARGLAAGRRADAVSVVDVAPTLLALAGLPPLSSIDGRDVSRAGAERDLYAETLQPRFDHGWSGLRALVRGPLKLVDGPRPELFDLQADPAELRDLWPGRAGEEMRRALGLFATTRRAEREALDAAAREALASLGYAASSAEAADELGLERPDPRARVSEARELDRAASDPDASRAAARLLQMARRDPGNNLAWRRLASARVQAGQFEPAIAAYREAVRAGYAGDDLADALGEAHLRAGERRAGQGDWDGARRLILEAVRLQPRRAEPRHALGVVHALAGRPEPAREEFAEAVRLEPAYAPAWFALGLAEERRGREEEALAAYRRFVELARADSPEARHARRRVDAAR